MQTSHRPSVWQVIRPILVIASAAALFVLAWRVGERPEPKPAATPPISVVRPDPERIEAFLRNEIDPILADSAEQDLAAAERALATLHERFRGFHAGVEPFVEEVSGWGTRFGVLGRSIGDGWNHYIAGEPDASAVKIYIEEKFHRHVVSEAALRGAVEESLVQFQEDLAANRNVMLARVRARLTASDVPVELRDADMAALSERFTRRSAELLDGMGGDILANGAAAFAGGAVAEEVARRLAIQIIARVATQMATSAAVSSATTGGATAGGAVTGGATGSAVGPVGTVIGLGVGLAVGIAVDWWMSERFEAKLAGQCDAFLTDVERELIDGSPEAPGLRTVLNDSIQATRQRHREALLASLLENPS
jgi:hypothetical protein